MYEEILVKLFGPTCFYAASIIALNAWNRHNMLLRAAIYGKGDKLIGERLVPAAVIGLELSRLVALLLSVGYAMQIGDVLPAYRWHAVAILVGASLLCFTYQTFLSIPVKITWAILKFRFGLLR